MARPKAKYLSFDPDRHSNERSDVRVPGLKQIRLVKPPNSAAFWAEYKAARDNPPALPGQPAAKRITVSCRLLILTF